jgi:hypothetical protein
MSWIKFHSEIRQGKHRGIPRALRFVLLELSLEARPGRGTVDLPMGMTLLDGVHDLLGGSRREVQQALELYTAGPDPDAPTVRVEGKPGALRLVIPSWEKWNALDSSAERMRRLRQSRAVSSGGDASRDVTPCDAVTPLDQRREDQKREDPPVVPPRGTQLEQVGLLDVDDAEQSPEKPAKGKGGAGRQSPKTPLSPDWRPTEAHRKWSQEHHFTAAELDREADKFRNHAAQNDRRAVRWDAAFGNWLIGAEERRANVSGALQRPAKPGEFQWKRAEET